MQVVLTVVDPALGVRADVLVKADADALVSAIVPQLVAAVGGLASPPGTASVTSLHGARVQPPIYVGGALVDPGATIAGSPLREGCVVSLGDSRGCLPREPQGLIEIRVVSGPGAGGVHRLGIGSYTIGTTAESAIRLAGAGIPDSVGTVTVTTAGEVTLRSDVPGSAPAPDRPHDPAAGPIVLPGDGKAVEMLQPGHRAALLEVDRRPQSDTNKWSGRAWAPGSQLTIGPVVLELAAVQPPDASLSASPNGGILDFNRPPRLLPPPRLTEFNLPAEPEKPRRQSFPLMMMALPLVASVAMAVFLRQPGMLLFGLLSPLLYIGQYFQSRREGKTSYKQQLAEYRDRKRRIEAAAMDALADEREARRRDVPDAASLLLFATGPRSRLWERRPTDPDWLELRLGTADLASEVVVEDATQDSHVRRRTWTAPDVPATVPLASVGVLGIAAPNGDSQRLGAWLTGQLATLHGPQTLRLMVLCPPDSAADWAWTRWLPHLRGGEDDGYLDAVGNDDETTIRRIAELTALVEARRKSLGNAGSEPPAFAKQLVVVMDGARRLRLLPGVVALLRDGPSVGVRFICLDADERQLPDEAQAVVTPHGSWWRLRRTGARPIDGIRADLVTSQWLDRLARSLSPIRDVSGGEGGAALPDGSRLLSVLGMDPPGPEQIAALWKVRGRTTQALLGEGIDGNFVVDIVRDGPHGLVAGTTGAGKSELLQTLIASLAIGNRPDEMNFVLVDYKGGAAFKDCNHLPHTVGMVTDLDGHLTTRALASLAAELHRRERQLKAADAKDIEEYLERMAPGDEPMPRLLIVIDEFAAMVTELPDFVTGIVDIARRGRSLGVHLILATQRPAGVVTNDIKANTNLRIALRVTDAGDSTDVIEAPDAARIGKSTPGRGYARLGHSSLVPFQTSRVGGRPPALVASSVLARVAPWHELGRPVTLEADSHDDDPMTPTDLAVLVRSLQESARLTGVATPPSPWLPPLPLRVTLDQLEPGQLDDDGRVPPIPFGLCDVPHQQARATAAYDLNSPGPFGIVGTQRSGRSATLRAIAASIARLAGPSDVHLYGVDCGNNALLPLINLPHTGAVVARDQLDRLMRLTDRLKSEIGRRQQQLAASGFADIAEQRRRCTPADRLPYLVILLDRWEAFRAAFEQTAGGRLYDDWFQILQEGAAVGVKTILTADKSVLAGPISTLLEDKLMLRMADSADFLNIGMAIKDVPQTFPPGRGFRAEGGLETQVALLTDDDSGTAQVAALHEIAARSTPLAEIPFATRPFRVDPLPVTISTTAALALGPAALGDSEILAGVGGDTLGLRAFDAHVHGPGILVAGPTRSGRSTALLTLIESMISRGRQVVAVAPRRSPLLDLPGTEGVVRVFGADADSNELAAVLDGLRTPHALVIDDLELIGEHTPLAELIESRLGQFRDTGNLVIAAGTTAQLNSMYVGPAAAIKRSRTGLVLAAEKYDDAEILGVMLPTGLPTGSPPGRAIMITTGSWQRIQVATPSA
ncbi:FtsK/SpoIIIE domain-containing protein [Kribbella solani]|uniref:S-DNA-T family DNA segregation ATPase FtsK/SpoIIIE n=1 Tax=Kribbella solani TaxID=236067 RepID=A0A841DQ09_9ACTN|nr:FtsK/SpoIIIE domain-containing protein [Kribbella solani]MBB5979981.1 S-DNA-T family DNA segregation ATPase FtsK/SpoIIIE [Kribbella solani]